MKRRKENEAILIADSHHGIFIPKLVLESQLKNHYWDFSKCSNEDIECVLEGPENEFYWDAWCNIEENVSINYNGVQYCLIFNYDLWAVPSDSLDQIGEWFFN